MLFVKSELEYIAPATAQKNINLEILNNIYVPFPSIDEQKMIIKMLDGLFHKEKASLDLYNISDEIELLKKTILSKVFRGSYEQPYN